MDAKDVMQEVAQKIERAANVRAVFGEPMGEGADEVIPVARVSIRGGRGSKGDSREGRGGLQRGLGLNVVAAPVGYIKRGSEGAAYVPIVDRNRVIAAGAVIAALGLLVVGTGIKVFGGK